LLSLPKQTALKFNAMPVQLGFRPAVVGHSRHHGVIWIDADSVRFFSGTAVIKCRKAGWAVQPKAQVTQRRCRTLLTFISSKVYRPSAYFTERRPGGR